MRRTAILILVALALVPVAGCDWLPGVSKPAVTGPAARNAFTGTLQVEFLVPRTATDRSARLLAAFGYTDLHGNVWEVPAGYVTDGASIPWGLWSFIGGPFDGPYRDAAVIHDHYCEMKIRPPEQVHRMFFDAALARGVPENTATIMYTGILYGGPTWSVAAPASAAPKKTGWLGGLWSAQAQSSPPPGPPPAPGLAKPQPTAAERRQFEELQRWILEKKPSLAEIERKVAEIKRSGQFVPLMPPKQ